MTSPGRWTQYITPPPPPYPLPALCVLLTQHGLAYPKRARHAVFKLQATFLTLETVHVIVAVADHRVAARARLVGFDGLVAPGADDALARSPTTSAGRPVLLQGKLLSLQQL